MQGDAKEREILELLAQGMTREQIAEKEGKTWKSVDQYMRRRDYKWSSEQQTYVIKEQENGNQSTSKMIQLNTKAAQIIRMLNSKHPDIRQIATKQGFESVEAMGMYMKGHGYIWDDALQNYTEQEQTIEEVVLQQPYQEYLLPDMSLGEQQILRLLVENQERLLTILNLKSSSSMQTFRFRGMKVNKTLTITSGAATLLEDYCKEYNVTQRVIVETALAEFFERHGFAEQLRCVTN